MKMYNGLSLVHHLVNSFEFADWLKLGLPRFHDLSGTDLQDGGRCGRKESK